MCLSRHGFKIQKKKVCLGKLFILNIKFLSVSSKMFCMYLNKFKICF